MISFALGLVVGVVVSNVIEWFWQWLDQSRQPIVIDRVES